MSYAAHSPASMKRVLQPTTRFTWCFCLSVFLLGPFGFVVGPLLSRYLRRRAEQRYPAAAGQAAAQDPGLGWRQWWLLTFAAGMGLIWLVALLPMVAFVFLGGLGG